MRILIATQTYQWGVNGQGVFTIHLAEGLRRRGWEVAVVFPSDKGRSYHTVRNGVDVYGVHSLSLAPFYPQVSVTLFPSHEVASLLDAFQPELVHFQDHYPLCSSVARQVRGRGLPLVGTNHFIPRNLIDNVGLFTHFRRFLNAYLWKQVLSVYHQADVVTAPTETAARLLRENGLHTQLEAITCGYDPQRFYPNPSLPCRDVRRKNGIDPERKLFLYTGRLDKEKKLEVLFRALALLKRDDIQLAIVGKGTQRKSLEKLVDQLGVRDRVVFLGYLPDYQLRSILNCSDFFAMPSEAELQSIATLEAMATGRPVLAANALALPELVHPGQNGYLFHAGDPAAAAQGMVILIDQCDRWQEMSQNSIHLVEPHKLENMLQQYIDLYSKLK